MDLIISFRIIIGEDYTKQGIWVSLEIVKKRRESKEIGMIE